MHINESNIEKFHTYIYFDETTLNIAKDLYKKANEEFSDLYVGTFHEKLVGPHQK